MERQENLLLLCGKQDSPVHRGGTEKEAAVNGDIVLNRVGKQFRTEDGALEVLRDVDLTLPANQITVLLGKSGCGKTPLLRLVGGLDRAYTGTITLPEGGRTGIVFQEPRLMPWLTVEKNIAFGLTRREADREKLRDLLELTGLTAFARLKPAQLSGGMEQRAAIARALAVEPDFLLMDEPFAALDYFTRAAMQSALLDIRKQRNCGVLFITHSIEEAFALGDRIAVLRKGAIRKVYPLTEDARRDPSALADLKADILNTI